MMSAEPPTSRDARTRRGRTAQRVLLAGSVILLLVIAATYTVDGQWSTAAGVLTGGGSVLVLMHLAGRRAGRKGVDAGTASRVFGNHADERDRRVYISTLATVGIAGLFVTAGALVAVGLGADAVAMLRAMPYVLFGTGIVSFVVIDRRT